MPIEILMPALSPTMEEGTLSKWVKNEGDTVKSGDVIAEIETDKATMEVEAVDEGVIGKLLIAAGTEGVKVNTAIAVLLQDGESADAVAAPKAAAKPAETEAPKAAEPAPAAAPVPAQPKGETAADPDIPAGTEMVATTVREALRDLLALQEKLVTIDNIQKTVAEYYKIKIADLLSKRRSRSVARPRQMAMALAKELTNHSLPEIGDAFGGRDHTTVLHACRKIEQLREESHDIKEDFSNLIRTLSS